MRPVPLLAALLAVPLTLGAAQGRAHAQTPAPDDGNAAHGAVGQPLKSGANSFTEGQVRERFAKMGFNEVTDLKKDDQGIWRGTAMHAGKSVSIGMDYKGDVAAQ